MKKSEVVSARAAQRVAVERTERAKETAESETQKAHVLVKLIVKAERASTTSPQARSKSGPGRQGESLTESAKTLFPEYFEQQR